MITIASTYGLYLYMCDALQSRLTHIKEMICCSFRAVDMTSNLNGTASGKTVISPFWVECLSHKTAHSHRNKGTRWSLQSSCVCARRARPRWRVGQGRASAARYASASRPPRTCGRAVLKRVRVCRSLHPHTFITCACVIATHRVKPLA